MPGLELRFDHWPPEDRRRWEAAFENGDRFDEGGRGAHLAATTQCVLKGSYARFLTFISECHRDRLGLLPEQRIDRPIIVEYVAWRRRARPQIVLAVDLHHLRLALRLICPDRDWSWLLTIAKRIATSARQKAPRHHLITSERLYTLGIELMDRAA